MTNSTLVLDIDQHRLHLAILESYQLLQDLKSLQCQNPSSLQLINRCLVRLQFFLAHSDSPILSHSDRAALARVHQHDLAQSLDLVSVRVRDLARDRHR